MYAIQKTGLYGNQYDPISDTTAVSPDPDPADPWLFTDPSARSFYFEHGLIGQLEDDIRTYAMFDDCWTPEELEYKLEVRRLLREGYIAPRDSFGHISPHPTIYRTLREGSLEISGQRYAFTGLEVLMFEPWLARYSNPGLRGPLQVCHLRYVAYPCLCCDAFPNVCIHCDITRAMMRRILTYGRSEQ